MAGGIVFLALLITVPFNEKRLEVTCGTCHPLDPVHAARLSRSDWSRELDKMQAMGAKIEDRKTLLDYLTARYGQQRGASRDRASGDRAYGDKASRAIPAP